MGFDAERPSSAMSDSSINIPDLAATTSRPPSRLGDDISCGDFDPFSEIPASFESTVPAPSAQRVETRGGQSMTLNEDKQRLEEVERRKSEEARRLKEKKEAEAEKAREEEEKRKAELKAEEERKKVELK